MFSARFATRCAGAFRTIQRQQARKMGSNAHHDHHDHHGPAPDTAYDPALNQKFDLPPIPKDGIFRRPRIDMNAHGPWHRSQDMYMRDATDMVTIFDRNGPANLKPEHGALQSLGFISAVICTGLFIPISLFGDENAPAVTGSFHDGPVPSLVSVPHAHARKVVVEIV